MNDCAQTLAATLIRNYLDAPRESFRRDPLYQGESVRLAPGTAADKLGVSYDVLAPGKRSCPYHLHHAQEEMFIILEGGGSLRVAGETLPLRSGDVVFIPAGPDYPHQIINTSDAPLKYLSVSTQESPEIVEYPDSGKFLAGARHVERPSFGTIQRSGEGLNYWDGEP